MAQAVSVAVHAHDPISSAGIAAQLRGRPEIQLRDGEDIGGTFVAIVVADDVDNECVRLMKSLRSSQRARIVLVATRIDDAALFTAIEAGACAFLRRSEATGEALVAAVAAAITGAGTVPPDLLGRLLNQLGHLQRGALNRQRLTFEGLTEREVEILKLVAEGLSTGEIAGRLSYSERTIKNVLHDVTTRNHLRNRSHAVAYAIRAGII